MSEHERKFYLKLKIDEDEDEDQRGIMGALIVSGDLDAVNVWDGSNIKQQETKNKNKVNQKSAFKTVSKDFIRAISVYQNSVPLIMSILPRFSQILGDRKIRGFAKKHGHCLESGEYELYEFSTDYMPSMRRMIDRTNSINGGIEAIPRLFFLGLVSAYDAFLSDLIRAILISKPCMLSASEKNISFRDLMSMGSVESARDYIIEKEIESVMRTSHHDQILWLETKLNMKLTKELTIYPEFIELCERRNLFTHTKGIVSSQYCKVCSDHNVKHSVNVGDTLSVSSKYFKHAISILFELGVKLNQVIWRKLLPEEVDVAASDLNNIAYDLIKNRDYKSADVLLTFGLEIMKKHGSDATRKMMVVNRANSLKLGGDRERALAILNKEDWSAVTDDYKICIAAINDDITAVIELMKKVVDSGLVDKGDIREWPVFEKAREDARFVEAFEAAFGEKLLRAKEAAARPTEAT